MTRSPFVLAALASSAVSGLDPVSVESVVGLPGAQFDVAFVTDSQERRWVVRAPVSAVASAQMDQSVALLGLLSRRLPYAVPAPRGFAPLKEGGRAAVYPYLPGRSIDLARLPVGEARDGLAAEIGRAVAQLHNLDLALFEEAGAAAYDPETYRTRRLAELDRGAATGSVPSSLLHRWEAALEELSDWRFAPTPTHGALSGRHLLVTFDDESDAATGHVRALTGWEHAKVADPADDFAGLVAYSSPDAVDVALEAYAHARVERPDPHLRRRALIASELAVLGGLLRALSGEHLDVAQLYAGRLHMLEARVADGSQDRLLPIDPPARHSLPPSSSSTSEVFDAAEGSAADPTSPSFSASAAETTVVPVAEGVHRTAATHGAHALHGQVDDPDPDLVDDNSDDGEPSDLDLDEDESADDVIDDSAEEAGYDLEPAGSSDTPATRPRGERGADRRGVTGGVEPTELIDISEYTELAGEPPSRSGRPTERITESHHR